MVHYLMVKRNRNVSSYPAVTVFRRGILQLVLKISQTSFIVYLFLFLKLKKLSATESTSPCIKLTNTFFTVCSLLTLLAISRLCGISSGRVLILASCQAEVYSLKQVDNMHLLEKRAAASSFIHSLYFTIYFADFTRMVCECITDLL